MEIRTTFSPLTEAQLKNLRSEVANTLSKEDVAFFTDFVKPYEVFGYEQLDNIFLIAQVTIRGDGQIENLTPHCSINQQDWWLYEDEPDMQIDDVNVAFKMLIPQPQFIVAGSRTFFAVLKAEGNIWDSCKDLPQWVWDQRKFEFMLSFSISVDSTQNYAIEHATKTISF